MWLGTHEITRGDVRLRVPVHVPNAPLRHDFLRCSHDVRPFGNYPGPRCAAHSGLLGSLMVLAACWNREPGDDANLAGHGGGMRTRPRGRRHVRAAVRSADTLSAGPDMSAPLKDHNAVFATWVASLDAIRSDLVGMHTDREVWRSIVDMLQGKESIPNRFWIRDWITQQYVQAQVISVRRQSEPNADVMSVAGLLYRIQSNPRVITRGRYHELYSPDNDYGRMVADDIFDRWAGPGGESVDPERVESRISSLAAKASSVSRFANRRLAHLDRRSVGAPTFDELDDVLDALGSELMELELLLKAVSLSSVAAVIINPWRKAFSVAWLPDHEIRSYERLRDQRSKPDDEDG